jgi:hypothetical protein
MATSFDRTRYSAPILIGMIAVEIDLRQQEDQAALLRKTMINARILYGG